MALQAHRLPTSHGWQWIADGFRLFRKNPPLLGFLVFGYWFLLLLLDMLPGIGPVAAALCVPAMSMSVMNGCRSIEEGRRPELLPLLFSGFKRNARVLATLGGLNFLSWLFVLFLSQLVDGGALMEALTSGQAPEPEAFANPRTQFAMLATLLLMVPVLMAFWFAPFLAGWEDCGAPKALFISFVATWRNGRAFFGYGMGLILVSGILPGLFLGLLGAISPTLFTMAATVLTLPLLLVFVPTLFASFYMSFKDVFGPGDEEAPAALPEEEEEGRPPEEDA